MSTLQAEQTMNRNDVIKAIKAALQRRSGKTWSVTGGRGTSYCWIHIDAPPARQTWRHRLPEGAIDRPENWEGYDSGQPGGSTTPAELKELATLLGLDTVHGQGVSIPASHDYYREYLDRAEGRPVRKIAEPYWD